MWRPCGSAISTRTRDLREHHRTLARLLQMVDSFHRVALFLHVHRAEYPPVIVADEYDVQAKRETDVYRIGEFEQGTVLGPPPFRFSFEIISSGVLQVFLP